MTVQPLVSIIIPVYNAEKYVAETILSAINQTWPNKEIIVVDDGSTDNSLCVAKSFESPEVKIYSQANKGASAARNRGLKEARGDYIQFLDADDLLSTDKIAAQINILIKNSDKMAVCSTVHFMDGVEPAGSMPSAYEEGFLINAKPVPFLINLWGGNNFQASMVQPNAWLTPKAVIDKAGTWNEELTVDDDGEFFARALLCSNGVMKSGGLNYYRKYQLKESNLSALKNEKSLNSSFKAILLKKQVIFSYDKSEAAQKAIFKQLKELAIRCYLKQPALYKNINKELKHFENYKFIPEFGGKTINFISQKISWKLAKLLQLISQYAAS